MVRIVNMEVERIQDSIKRNYENVFSRNRKNKKHIGRYRLDVIYKAI